jgi:queuine tRNA-ribosyltransferase
VSLDCAVVLTRAGVRAMLDRNTGELMHPGIGPLAEAERLYVGPARLAERLREPSAEPLVLFDVGLGAGTNAAAAFRLSESVAARRLIIISFDQSLAAFELALMPENAGAFGLDGEIGDRARTLLADRRCEGHHTEWRLVLAALPSALAQLGSERADVVFWDPFSPRRNPELWTSAAFATLRSACRAGATLHTYSGATAVRSALLLAGFSVGLGPLIAEGKRATEAAIERAVAEPLDRRWLERLRRSSAPLPVDSPAGALERIAAAAQFQT